MDPSIAQAKLSPPAYGHLAISRPELVRRLNDAPVGSLRSIIAPAGWGKSHLVAEWIRQTPLPVAYIRADRFDNDQMQFWLHVLSALRSAAGIDVEDLIASLRLPAVELVTQVVRPALARLGTCEILLVLEDVQEIGDVGVQESLVAFLDALPKTVIACFTSRDEPTFGLERRRVEGLLVDIRLHDLAFDDASASVFLEACTSRLLLPGTAASLNALVEGWPAGLSLAGLALEGGVEEDDLVGRFSGDDRTVSAYLAETMLGATGAVDLQFMRSTALLSELDPELCDAVREATDSGSLLEEVARRNQFLIPSSTGVSSYRYHGLFRQWLQLRTDAQSERATAAAHQRAAIVYADRSDALRAMDHALSGNAIDLAHELFQQFALGTIAEGNHATVAQWCRRFPTNVSPQIATTLRLTQAWEAIYEGDLDLAERCCDILSGLAEERVAQQRPLDGAGSTNWTGNPAQVATIRSFCELLRCQFVQAEKCWNRAGSGATALSDRDKVPLLFLEAALSYWLGRDSQPSFRAMSKRAQSYDDPFAALLADCYVVHSHLDNHDYDQARSGLDQILEVVEQKQLSSFWYGSLAKSAHARVLLIEGKFSDAYRLARAAIELAESANNVPEQCLANLVAAEAAHNLGRQQAARQHAAIVSDLLEPVEEAGVLRERLAVCHRQLRLRPMTGIPRFSALPVEDLSNREQAVLRLLPTMLNQREIGRSLGLSLNTVKSYNRSIYRKLGVSSRDDAVAVARANNLLN